MRGSAYACSRWENVDNLCLSPEWEAGQPWAAQMTFVTPVVALSLLAVLSLVAREKSYPLTSTSLMVVTGVLGVWYAAVYWAFG